MQKYSRPVQSRALSTEGRFLESLQQLLLEKPLSQLTIDEVAGFAGLSRGAFLKRFGSKRRALFVLYARCGEGAAQGLQTIRADLARYTDLDDFCCALAASIEHWQWTNMPVIRAVMEDFLGQSRVTFQTKKLFVELFKVMREAQRYLHRGETLPADSAMAATQTLITISVNYALNAMPALPADAHARNRLIGKTVAETLRYRVNSFGSGSISLTCPQLSIPTTSQRAAVAPTR